MREIKFRGRRTDNREWVYGFYCRHDYGAHYQDKKLIKAACSVHDIWTNNGWATVNEASVGQYTGLKDKEGREIYEGDIVQAHSKYKFAVIWIGTSFMLKGINYKGIENIGNFLPQDIEVIGNIHTRKEEPK